MRHISFYPAPEQQPVADDMRFVRQQGIKWDSAHDELLKMMYNDGASLTQIAKALHTTSTTVSRRIITLINFGELITREFRSERERCIMAAIPRMAQLYREGYSLGELADMLNLSEWQVSCIVLALRKHGVITQLRASHPRNDSIESVLADTICQEMAKRASAV